MPPSGVLCAQLGQLWEPGASQGGNRSQLPPSCEDRASGWLRDASGSPSVPSALSLAVLVMAKSQVPKLIRAL